MSRRPAARRTFEFQSNLARIRLRLSASTDHDVRKLVLDYNLEILPILMKFESHQQAEWPLDAIDRQAIANWIDDRLVDFVKTYLSLHQNEYYLKDHMVDRSNRRHSLSQVRGGGQRSSVTARPITSSEMKRDVSSKPSTASASK